MGSTKVFIYDPYPLGLPETLSSCGLLGPYPSCLNGKRSQQATTRRRGQDRKEDPASIVPTVGASIFTNIMVPGS